MLICSLVPYIEMLNHASIGAVNKIVLIDKVFITRRELIGIGISKSDYHVEFGKFRDIGFLLTPNRHDNISERPTLNHSLLGKKHANASGSAPYTWITRVNYESARLVLVYIYVCALISDEVVTREFEKSIGH